MAVMHEARRIEQDVDPSTRLAKPSTGGVADVERAVSAMPSARWRCQPCSVAITLAPSRAKASARARPMPTAAAVTTARFPSVDRTFFIFLHSPFVFGAERATTRNT
jgi:hypothetical protein